MFSFLSHASIFNNFKSRIKFKYCIVLYTYVYLNVFFQLLKQQNLTRYFSLSN